SMTEPSPRTARFKSRNLLGALVFLRKYPVRVTLCLSVLMIDVGIHLSLPQFIGDAITGLRQYIENQAPFSPAYYVRTILALVVIRAGVAYILGPIRNRTVQSALGDIRAA